MEERNALVAGVVLVLVGAGALALALASTLVGFVVWRLWPLIVIAVGLSFVLPPLLLHDKRALGCLFVPGLPVLTTGCLLLAASMLGAWGIWEWLWPQEVLAVALGFLFAAICTRVIWLLVPAITIGATGLLLQFCVITGLWSVWAVLWTIVPLSLGLALLAVNVKVRSAGLFVAGAMVCAMAAVGAAGSVATLLLSALLPAWWLWNWVAPVTLIIAGVGLLLWGLLGRPLVQRAAAGMGGLQ